MKEKTGERKKPSKDKTNKLTISLKKCLLSNHKKKKEKKKN